MHNSFLSAFGRLRRTCADEFELVGDCLIVEVLPSEALSKEVKGSDGKTVKLFLSGGDKRQIDGLEMNLPLFCRVLAVGNGFYDPDEEKVVNLEMEPGDIILVGPMAIKRLSAFGPLVSTGERQLAITREAEVQLRFKGAHGYEKCFHALKETVCADAI